MYNCKRGIDFTCTSADSFLLNHWYRYYKCTSIQYVPSLQSTKYFLCLLIYIWFGSNALKVSLFITIFFWRNLPGTRQLYLWWLCVYLYQVLTLPMCVMKQPFMLRPITRITYWCQTWTTLSRGSSEVRRSDLLWGTPVRKRSMRTTRQEELWFHGWPELLMPF